MKNSVKIALYIFQLLFLFFNFCHAQSTTQAQGNSSLAEKRLKIVKTHGSDEFQGISCGIQDHEGNLWFGAGGEGVYRYDGKLFEQFSVHNGLCSNDVGAIFEDRNNNVWIGTNNGLCCYDGKTMKHIAINLGGSFTYPSTGTNPVSDHVHCIMQDKKGILWFGTAAGVFCYDGISFSVFLDRGNMENKSKLTLKDVQCIFEDQKGNIWFGSGPMAFEGLCVYDGKTLTKAGLENEDWIRKIAESNDGKLLITTRRIGIFTFDGKTFARLTAPPELSNILLTYALEDSKGNFWFGSDYLKNNDITTGGLWKFDKKLFTRFTKKDGLRNTSTCFILEDKNKNIWIGTRNNGLYFFDGKTFTSFYE